MSNTIKDTVSLTLPPRYSEEVYYSDFNVRRRIYAQNTSSSSRVIRNRANRVIGMIILHGCDGNEIGYYLMERYRNFGIMTKMVQEFCQTSHLKRITACVAVGNIPSQKVLEKASFIRNPVSDKGCIESTWLRP